MQDKRIDKAEPADGVRAEFIHLRVHSAYSLLEGAIPVKKLPKLCLDRHMPAVAVTDTNNLFGAIEIAETLSGAGIQPIIGCTLSVDCGIAEERKRVGAVRAHPSVAVLVQNEAGWLNLMKLASRAHLSVAPTDTPHVKLPDLAEHAAGLILLTGGPNGPLNRLLVSGQGALAEGVAATLAAAFPNRLYVELQRHGTREEEAAEQGLIDLAYKHGLPLVATNEPFFADEAMFEAHDALLCIAEGRYVTEEDRRRVTPEHRFKSAEEMQALFADLPEAIAATVEIARRCAFRPQKKKPILPKFEVPDGRTPADELRAQATEGLGRRLALQGLNAPEETYRTRLDYELGVITKMGFEGYFLIVSDFMRWTRAQGIPVGVRGSGATSIVAWALDITSLDPIRFNLVFERFLNPERVSMPDFDIDFCQDRRDEVIRYVQEKYGRDRVAQIITFGTLAARAAVRDVGRVLQMPYGLIDRISKLIPNIPGKQITLREAISGDERLRQLESSEEGVARLFEIVERIEGLYRHASTHAAGLVIGDRPLDELTPLYRDPKSDMPVTQFDYKDAEIVGLVKFDFLGLKTLTVIAKTEELIARRGVTVKSETVSFDNKPSYDMLAHGDSVGVFQLESAGMRDLLRRLKPDRIEDLIALVALYRPGPMDSIPKYIACKHRREEPSYLHPKLEPILSETYGVMTYQEDVMLIARELASYTMGEADILRRAMGKKDMAEMAKHRSTFIERAGVNGIPKSIAQEIFDQAEKFAGYGFNKGHAAAYAQVAFQTAYLKANYPAEFICASMTLDIGSTDRLNTFKQEAERLAIRVLPPDINRSEALFSVEGVSEGKPAIRYALSAIRNVGRAAMEHVEEVRAAGGRFPSLFDFARRVDPRFVNKRALESLACAGAFDSLNPSRAQVLASVDAMLGQAGNAQRERESGQVSLFGDVAGAAVDPPLPLTEEWKPTERLQREFEAVGFYLSGHPLDDYATALRRAQVVTYAEIANTTKRETRVVNIAGVVVGRKDKKSRERDTSYAFVRLSDPSAVFETVVFSDTLSANDELLQPGRSVVLTAVADWIDDELKLRTQTVRALDRVAADTGAGLRIFLDDGEPLAAVAGLLNKAGKGQVSLVLMVGGGREVEVQLPTRFAVTPQLRGAVRAVRGVVEVEEV